MSVHSFYVKYENFSRMFCYNNISSLGNHNMSIFFNNVNRDVHKILLSITYGLIWIFCIQDLILKTYTIYSLLLIIFFKCPQNRSMSAGYLVAMKLRFGRKYKNDFYCGEDFSKDSVSFTRNLYLEGII